MPSVSSLTKTYECMAGVYFCFSKQWLESNKMPLEGTTMFINYIKSEVMNCKPYWGVGGENMT